MVNFVSVDLSFLTLVKTQKSAHKNLGRRRLPPVFDLANTAKGSLIPQFTISHERLRPVRGTRVWRSDATMH
jgi:hypothetical protein